MAATRCVQAWLTLRSKQASKRATERRGFKWLWTRWFISFTFVYQGGTDSCLPKLLWRQTLLLQIYWDFHHITTEDHPQTWGISSERQVAARGQRSDWAERLETTRRATVTQWNPLAQRFKNTSDLEVRCIHWPHVQKVQLFIYLLVLSGD